MNIQIFDANAWLYPDSEITKPIGSNENADLFSARNAYSGIQILCRQFDPHKALTVRADDKPGLIQAEIYRLMPVWVEKNTATEGFCVAEKTAEKPAYSTRKAPFWVYDAISPLPEEAAEPASFTPEVNTAAYYIAFFTSADTPEGVYQLPVTIEHDSQRYEITVSLRVYRATVPETENLYISNWFGLSLIAERHNLTPWSAPHWERIRQYGQLMRRTRQTHFLIPREAMTVRRGKDGRYQFDFTQTKRLIELFFDLGFRYIEGALVAGRIHFGDASFVVDAAGKTVPALSAEGYDYIVQYLTAWKAFLAENGWLARLWQHVADEPTEACAQEYRIISGMIRKYLPGVPLMEAVETTDLDGAVEVWIPKNAFYQEHQEEFERIRQNGDKLWFYTCCIPGGYYLNRLWDMPLIRTRLLHWGNYRYNLEGYLHWGFNYCDGDKNPYEQTELLFPPGDTHLSYPSPEGVNGSMRLEMMRGGIEDYELLRLLSLENKPLADRLAADVLPAFDKAKEDTPSFNETRRALMEALEAGTHFTTKTLSPLVKVFADSAPEGARYSRGTALHGEHFSFQVGYAAKEGQWKIRVETRGIAENAVTLYKVGLVPVELAAYADHDDYLLRNKPGLYPDLLETFETVDALAGCSHSLWVEIDTQAVTPGDYTIEIRFIGENKAILGRVFFNLTILDTALSKPQLLHTEWFYLDCLATAYNTEVFSPRHEEIIAHYLSHYAAHGMNMVLTPLFTPPLETDFGLERPTVQLVDVRREDGVYHFDFSRLRWFIRLCRDKGITYFEFSHLFSQWGAAYAPKVMATVDGAYQRIFGWDTPADSEAYVTFLQALLLALDDFIQGEDIGGQVYFHISDEPNLTNLDSYRKASQLIKASRLPYPILDALSDYAFYQNGLVDAPVASTEHIDKFLIHETENLWAYYCCCEYRDGLSNRFMNMPGQRTRMIGLQLYKAGIRGFLHWGYNHWYSARSRQIIDPYRVTDALHAFPAGDAFLVYPGEDGHPVNSIRMKLIRMAMEDIRVAQTLEDLAGRDYVISLLENNGLLSFRDYPRSPEALLILREAMNQAILSIKQGFETT